MAQRIATEIVNARWRMTETQYKLWINHLLQSDTNQHVLMLDNGNQEIVLKHGQDEAELVVEQDINGFQLMVSCRVLSPEVAELLRQAILTYSGDAIMYREYGHFSIIYTYQNGVVTEIREQDRDGDRIVYHSDEQSQSFLDMYQKQDIEQRIIYLRNEIDDLLDARILSETDHAKKIDHRLSDLTRELFRLEA